MHSHFVRRKKGAPKFLTNNVPPSLFIIQKIVHTPILDGNKV